MSQADKRKEARRRARKASNFFRSVGFWVELWSTQSRNDLDRWVPEPVRTNLQNLIPELLRVSKACPDIRIVVSLRIHEQDGIAAREDSMAAQASSPGRQSRQRPKQQDNSEYQ